MSSQVLKPLLVTKESVPRTHYIFMQYPIEVTECWANISSGKELEEGVTRLSANLSPAACSS